MQDEFLVYFGWLAETLKQPTEKFFGAGTEEYAIIEQLKAGWGKEDTAGLLRRLTAEYGAKAGQTVEKYLERVISQDWADIGREKAHEGSEIDDFIHLLWDPLKEQGFDFTSSDTNGRVEFCVTKCPIAELAEKTGLHEWLYHLACSTDYHTSRAFSPKIGFQRTKELVRGDDHCDHTYYYR